MDDDRFISSGNACMILLFSLSLSLSLSMDSL